MEALHDDILIRILSYLDLKSQLNIIDLHPRFYHLISIVWCSQYKAVSFSLYEAIFSKEHLKHFFQSICKTVQVLHLRMMSLEQFEVLISYIYPKVHDFRFATVPTRLLFDTDVPRIIQAFPNLKTFSPQGDFSGRNFTDIPSLERLTLSYCKRFCVENLVNIMKAHQLKEIKLCLFDSRIIETSAITLPVECMTSLESIKIELDELTWFQEHFSKLSKLKELTVCGSRFTGTLNLLCRKLGCPMQRRYLNILETCNSTDTLTTVIQAKLHVDALKIVTDNYLFENIGIFSSQNFEHINQMYFKSCCIENKQNLDTILRNITKVEFVSFEQCVFAFDNYEFLTTEIIEKRNKALRINLFQNTCLQTKVAWLWSLTDENSLLHISEGRNYEYTYEPIYMAFK